MRELERGSRKTQTSRRPGRGYRPNRGGTMAGAAPRGSTSGTRGMRTAGRTMRLRADLPGAGLEPARPQADLARTFPTLAAAKSWRHDAAVGCEKEHCGRPARHAQPGGRGVARGRGEPGSCAIDRATPTSPRPYAATSRRSATAILPALGTAEAQRHPPLGRAAARQPPDGRGPRASTIRNALMPLRAIYRHALALDEVAVNPTAACSCRPSAAGASGSPRRPRPPR